MHDPRPTTDSGTPGMEGLPKAMTPEQQGKWFSQMKNAGMKLEEIAQKTGKDEQLIRQTIEVSRLPAYLLPYVNSGRVTVIDALEMFKSGDDSPESFELLAAHGRWNGETYYIVGSHFIVQANSPQHAQDIIRLRKVYQESSPLPPVKLATVEEVIKFFTLAPVDEITYQTDSR